MKGTGSFDRVADVPNEKVVAPEPRKRGWVEIGGRGHIVEDRAPCGDPHAQCALYSTLLALKAILQIRYVCCPESARSSICSWSF